MIFNKWGEALSIVAYAGKHKPRWAAGQLVLVLTRYNDGTERYQFAQNLKADNGWTEIDAAMDAATQVALEGPALAKALKQAD